MDIARAECLGRLPNIEVVTEEDDGRRDIWQGRQCELYRLGELFWVGAPRHANVYKLDRKTVETFRKV